MTVGSGQLPVYENGATGILAAGTAIIRGISRSTAASISAASSAVKNIHGPGRAGSGGVAVPGDHGIAPEIVRALPLVIPAIKKAAVEYNSDRRDNLASKSRFDIRFFPVD